MRKSIIPFIIFLYAFVLQANPGVYHPGSSGMLIPFKINSVSLLSEKIDIMIDKYDEYIYFVQFNCSFELMNVSSKKQKIKIGFPVQYGFHESAYGQIWLNENYQDDLALQINGKTASYESTIYGLEPEPESTDILYEELYFFDVEFDNSERKQINVSYSMTISTGLIGGDTIVYVLMTAKTWKGPVENAIFRITCSFPAVEHEKSFKDFGIPARIDNSQPPETRIIFVFNKFTPERNLKFNISGLDSERFSHDNTVVMSGNALQQSLTILNQSNSFYSAYKINTILDKYKKSNKQLREQSGINDEMINGAFTILSDFYNAILNNPLTPLSFKMRIISNYSENNFIRLNSEKIVELRELDGKEKKNKTQYRIVQIKELAQLLEVNPGNRELINTSYVLARFLQMISRSAYKEYFQASGFSGDKQGQVLQHYYTKILTDIFTEENFDELYADQIFPFLRTYYPLLLDFFIEQIDVYTGKIWHSVKTSDRKKLEYVLSKCDHSMAMDFGLDFDEHQDLVRKAYYVLANSYIREDPKQAINLYTEAFLLTWSNTGDIISPSYLLTIDLCGWEHEGENNAPCYYIAYNMCCAYTLSGDIPTAFKWLRISLRMNPRLKNIILSDKDIIILRNDYSSEFNSIVEDELGISTGLAKRKKTLTKEEVLLPTPEENLHDAALEGNLNAVIKLVESGADVNKLVENTTPLIIASTMGNSDIVRYLLSHKADVNKQTEYGYNAFFGAFNGNHTEIIKLLLDAGVDLHTDYYKKKNLLQNAIYKQNFELVKLFVQNKIDINKKDNSGVTPLMAATKNGNMDITRYLIQNKAILNEQDNSGNSVLMHACSGNNMELFRFLVDKGANINLKNNGGKSVIVFAAEEGNREVVLFLLTHKPVCTKEENLFIQNFLNQEQNPDTGLLKAVKAGDLNQTREWLKQGANANVKSKDGYPAIYYAIKNKYDDITKELIKSGADVSLSLPNGNTLLSTAIYSSQYELVEYLVEEKKCRIDFENVMNAAVGINDPVMCEKMLKYLFKNGAKVSTGILREALWNSNTTALQILIENGADINGTVDWGYRATPLMFAAEKGKQEIIRWLLRHGADINKGDNYNDTPLMTAIMNNQIRIVKLLLREGADINHKNINKKTALDYAVLSNKEELVELLLVCGAISGK